MKGRILITGSTDGIGLKTARLLVREGHHVLLHGRSADKLRNVREALSEEGTVSSYLADLSVRAQVEELARTVMTEYSKIDVLINNAGVFRLPEPTTSSGFDLRFVVNTVAPYLLTRRLSQSLGGAGRVVNLSSAAQSPVSLEALVGRRRLDDGAAYAQSKLALTMWSRQLAQEWAKEGPAVIAVNPGSFLGSKMVKEAYGMEGADLAKGADILRRAALTDEFEGASGCYFDNDAGCFSDPHPDALNVAKVAEVTRTIEELSRRSNW